MVVQSEPESQSATAQFNERRRDMFFEDYNIKQIEVIDTSVVRDVYTIGFNQFSIPH